MTHASLFSGIGAAELAAKWCGWENLFHCEINPFGRKVLDYHFPKSISYADITTTDFTIWRGKVDILSGGFPCQEFSVAGLRKGTDGNRYLWPQMRRAYNEIRPRIIVAENVTGLLSMEDKSGVWKEVFPKVENRKITRFDDSDYYEAVYTRQSKMLINTILENLEKDGYEAVPVVIPASAVGAPHRRYRVWIIGYAKHDGSYESKVRGNDSQPPVHTGKDQVREPQGADSIQPSDAAHANSDDAGRCGHGETGSQKGKGESQRNQRQRIRSESERTGEERDAADSGCEQLQGSEQHGSTGCERALEGKGGQSSRSVFDFWKDFPTQSPICERNDGVPDGLSGITFSEWRVESIKALGNTWVVPLAYQIFKIIDEYEQSLQ